MSNTYNRDRQRKALRHLAEGSASVMDFRSRLIFISLLNRHPAWPPSLLHALAETRAFFVTVFQAPLERAKLRRMKRRLKRNGRKNGKH